uniref:Uncharacterized protein n=1 Tax=Setaria viridis TaxID=4556 RepID=A0A4U6VMF4_SETVI|nr:hypothetical protein SEVIR_3G396800v2 [Setaria viridis]
MRGKLTHQLPFGTQSTKGTFRKSHSHLQSGGRSIS